METIKNIISGYKGKIKETYDSSFSEIEIMNANILPLNNPNRTEKTKKVDCYLRVQYFPVGNYWHTDAYESTYEIIGGTSCRQDTKEKVIEWLNRYLDRYGFKQKENVQMELF